MNIAELNEFKTYLKSQRNLWETRYNETSNKYFLGKKYGFCEVMRYVSSHFNGFEKDKLVGFLLNCRNRDAEFASPVKGETHEDFYYTGRKDAFSVVIMFLNVQYKETTVGNWVKWELVK